MRRWIPAAALLLAAGVVVGALGIGVARLMGTTATPSVRIDLRATRADVSAAAPPLAIQGKPAPSIIVPAQGSMLLEASGKHLASMGGASLVALDADHVRPIASVAKAMTALVVVDAHPLSSTDSGPVLTVTDADVAYYRAAIAENGSNVPVVAGERFTERQLLEGLLVPSGNNLAETLAHWVGGSTDNFVAAMNRRAVGLGMARTHFADASGFDDRTVSTAADLARLGRALLEQGALAEIAAMPQITLPDGSSLPNTDPLVGQQQGWLGIKTGHDDAAGYCLLFAARLAPRDGSGADDTITYIGAVLAQPLNGAIPAARDAVLSAAAGYASVDPRSFTPDAGGSVTAAWGTTAGVVLGAGSAAERIDVRAGDAVELRAQPEPRTAPLPAGSRVGSIETWFGGRVVATWAADTDAELPGPSFWDRVLGRAG